MKKIVLVLLMFAGLAYGNCENFLREGDFYAKKVPLDEIKAYENAMIALMYYERYKLCLIQKPEEPRKYI